MRAFPQAIVKFFAVALASALNSLRIIENSRHMRCTSQCFDWPAHATARSGTENIGQEAYVMKRFFALFAVFCAATLGSSSQLTSANGPGVSVKQSAVVEFTTPVKLMNEILKGEYMFVHDEEMMEAGENCTFVYKMAGGKPVKLVVSFHCIPVPRPKVENFTMRSWLLSTKPPLQELQEYQFAGSNEGHQVPSKAETKSATVDLMPCCQ